MRLLILTQYFPPEHGAPQGRLYALARHLAESGVQVTVLTAMPHYPQMRIMSGYEGKKYLREALNGIEVHRTSIFVTQKRSVTSRLRNYFSFVWSSARAGRRLPPAFDFLLCESPPLFLGYAAMYLARRKKAKLIFNVSDLWPESAERLGVITNKFLLGLAYRLEAKLYRKSALVTGQTQGICSDIARRFPAVKTYWLPNGADLADFDPGATHKSWRSGAGIPKTDFVFLYAGILGLAQGLDVILDCAKQFRDRKDVWFVLIGDGPEQKRLQEAASGMENVLMPGPVPRSEMPAILAETTAAIVPLKDLPIFRGAIPSKIFESLAMEVPVVLGVDGEARRLFVEEGRCALYFSPGDASQMADCVRRLIHDPEERNKLGKNGRQFVKSRFDRRMIAQGFFEQLRKL